MNSFKYSIKNLIIIAIVLISANSFSQAVSKKYIDSVLTVTSSQNQDTKKKSYKNLLSKISKSNIEDPKNLFEYCLKNSIPEKDKLFVYEAYGNYTFKKGQTTEALTLFEKALNIAENLKIRESQIQFRVKLSYTSLFNNQLDTALLHINKAELLVDNENEDKLSSIYYNKGIIYNGLNDIENSTIYFLKAWDEINAIEDHPERGFILYELVYHFTSNELALEQALFTEELVQHYENKKTNLPNSHLPLINVLKSTADKKNIDHLTKVLKISDSLNVFHSFIYNSFTLSDIYIEIDQHEKAIDVLQNVEKRLDSLSSKLQTMATYFRLSEAYKVNNDFKEAHHYLSIWNALNQDVFSDAMQTSIAELEVQYDTAQKERELEKKQANQKLLIWVLSLVSALLLLGIFFYYKIRMKNSQLAYQKQELEKTVEEKNTLLKETHHRVKNSFQIVSGLLFLKSSTVKDKAASKVLTETQNRINSMAVLHQKLYKKDYTSGVDCNDYITDLVSDILSSYSNPHIEKRLDVESITLNIETVTSLGLIINELVTNSLKYAFTEDIINPYIEIKLYALKNNLVLRIIDNGIGFSEKQKEEDTLGISLVKDLATKINASVTFENLQNNNPKGTKITILIEDYKLQE